MTTLGIEPYRIPAAEIGPENPLPAFRGQKDDVSVGTDETVTDEDRRHLGWRTAWRVLPHRMQDSYTRKRREQEFHSIVLENNLLRAVFLPHLGGRLVSLYHKCSGRELLSRNPVFQPANLALRNAWFSGGIEWNSGITGHHYLTCSPVFAAEIETMDGCTGLRIYEWDRVQGYYWMIDFHLPAHSPLLFAHTRITNPHEHEIPMYWWTNIAVSERADVRVLVPADTAICNPYWKSLTVVDLPMIDGVDFSCSAQIPHSFDFFSRIPSENRKWIAALDRNGDGFFEASTRELIGRKLFCWGSGQGGRVWQEFLSVPSESYIEIQAGLARTQMECVPMPPRAEWEWTEVFGLLHADPDQVHASNWGRAWRSVEREIDQVIPLRRLEEWNHEFSGIADKAPKRVLSHGSGWGSLERRRRIALGCMDYAPSGSIFDDSCLDKEQEPWLSLLGNGFMPETNPLNDPGSLMIQREWRDILEGSVQTSKGDHWLAWWHLGNMRMEDRDMAGAYEAWEESLRRKSNGWAYRNIAVVARRQDGMEKSCNFMRKAWVIGPRIAPIAIEYAHTLLNAQHPSEMLNFINELPEDIRSHERILLLWAKAALEIGDIDGMERIFDRDFATIREGEVTLTDLWFAYHVRKLSQEEGLPPDDDLRERVMREYPPPRRIDFRMTSS